MRSFISSLVIISLVGIATSQRFRNFRNPQSGRPGGGGPIGLTAPVSVGPRGCFCIPGNQICVPDGPIPVTATKIDSNPITTRIVNLKLTNCPQDQNECCFGSLDNGGNGGPRPVPSSLTGCGDRQKLIPGKPGTDDADFGEYPWMTAILGQRDRFLAAGVLISPHWVLTTAHKISEPGAIKVRVGDYNLASRNEVPEFPHQERAVAQVILHPRFNSANLQNDVGLLRLESPVSLGPHINVACLPESFQRFSGQRCFLSGWGQNLKGEFQPILKEVDLPIVDEFECEESLRRTRLGANFTLDKDSFMCAGGEAGKDACGGDGGAPLVCDESGVFTVVGLVAWGIGCGQNRVPGVYVNLASFSNFIKDTIQPF